MQGIVSKEISRYDDCIVYDVILPYYIGNMNTVSVIINNDDNKEYINKTINFSGDLINKYNNVDGMLTYIKANKVEIQNRKYINFNNNIFSNKCIFYKVNNELSKTLKGTDIFKFSIKYKNKFNTSTVLDCIAFGKTAVSMSQFTTNDYLYVKGKLIARHFIYKAKYPRKILELHINEYNLLKKK